MRKFLLFYRTGYQLSWTQWFDTDDADGDGDDESLETIRSLHSEKMCHGTPLAMEVRLVGETKLAFR